MKKIYLILLSTFLIALVSFAILASAIDLIPQGSINGKDVYNIKNITNVSITSGGDLYLGIVGQKLWWYNHTQASGWNKVGTNVILNTITDRVGIGTATPTATLQVQGLTNSSFMATGKLNVTEIFSYDFGESSHLNIYPQGDLYLGQFFTNNIYLGRASSGSILTTIRGTFSVTNASGTQGLFQTAIPNVGIGTTTPRGKLDVNGTIIRTEGNATFSYSANVTSGEGLFLNKVAEWNGSVLATVGSTQEVNVFNFTARNNYNDFYIAVNVTSDDGGMSAGICDIYLANASGNNISITGVEIKRYWSLQSLLEPRFGICSLDTDFGAGVTDIMYCRVSCLHGCQEDKTYYINGRCNSHILQTYRLANWSIYAN
jgi:hypothetical protein